MTLGDRVFDYVSQNPGATHHQVSSDVGLSRSHARACLTRLQDQGLLAVRKNGHQPRRFYPADERVITERVVNRARDFGGPFAILVAQVVA